MNQREEVSAVWRNACGELAISLSEASFGSWVRPCFIDSINDIDEERLLIQLATPSSFHQKTVDERFYGQIKQVLEKQTGKKCELAIIVKQMTADEQKPKGGGEEKKMGLFNTVEQQRLSEEEAMRNGLNPRFTFENFIVGGANNLAYAAGRGVADSPGSKHNPLFIWGGVGVGKTHLMHAIGRAMISKGKVIKIVTSEQFTNEFIATVRSKTIGDFKKKYRNVDALMIDDIQFIAGKEGTQEEFFHTFNELYSKGKQIIMTCDRKPQDIDGLEERLSSRFLGGLTVDIGLPDYEMRMGILTQKSQELGAEVENGALELLATTMNTNTRELEGTLMRLLSVAAIHNSKLDKELVERELGVKEKRNERKMRPQEVISVVAKLFEYKNRDLLGKSRKAELVRVRHICMFILRIEMGLQLERVADLMGGRDHTTVMHAVDKMEREFNTSQKVREQIMKVKQALYS